MERLGLGEARVTVLCLNLCRKRSEVLHNFDANGTDGYYPEAGVFAGPIGNLYGTTCYSGTFDEGTVFVARPLRQASRG